MEEFFVGECENINKSEWYEIIVKKKSIKKIVISLAVLVAILIVIVTAFVWFYNHVYGTFSIPRWMRPTHEALKRVEDYHPYHNYNEPEDSFIPRIDIFMEEDYGLSGTKYTDCTVQISNADEYNLEASDAKIRIRGKTTQHSGKKPYKIKFLEETSLFGGGKEKSWVLLANATDITGIHNYVSLEVARKIMAEGTFVPMVHFVNLYINGKYQGVYNLCDQVEAGDMRVPISDKIEDTPSETDYLVVNDLYAYYEGYEGEGLSWFWLDKTIAPIEVKSPDTDDYMYCEEYTDYIKKRLDDIYDVILTRDWNAIQDVIDTDSVINGFLGSIICNNEDISWKSVYFYLPAGGRLTYGPVWDMDLTFGAGSLNGYHSILGEKARYNVFFGQLLKVPEFEKALKDRYKEIYPSMEQFIEDKIDEAVSFVGNDLENEFNIRADWGRYGTAEYKAAQTYKESIDYMKLWTHERLEYLYSYYNK